MQDSDSAVFPGFGRVGKKPRTVHKINGRLNPLPKPNIAHNGSLSTRGSLFVQGEGIQLGLGDDDLDAPRTKKNPLVDALVTATDPAMGSERCGGYCGGCYVLSGARIQRKSANSFISSSVSGSLWHNVDPEMMRQLWSFGSNDELSLDRAVYDDEATPQITPFPDKFKPVRVAATDCLSLALDAKGQLRQWEYSRSVLSPVQVCIIVIDTYSSDRPTTVLSALMALFPAPPRQLSPPPSPRKPRSHPSLAAPIMSSLSLPLAAFTHGDRTKNPSSIINSCLGIEKSTEPTSQKRSTYGISWLWVRVLVRASLWTTRVWYTLGEPTR